MWVSTVKDFPALIFPLSTINGVTYVGVAQFI